MNKLVGAERDKLLLEIIRRIESDKQIVGAPERAQVWERGWSEVLEAFKENPTEQSLMPAFVHAENPVRHGGDFYTQSTNMNERQFIATMQAKIGDYMQDADEVFEFGCGTGLNLVALAKRFPAHKFCGLDFTHSAVDLMYEIGGRMGLNIRGQLFNMRHPTGDFMLPKNSGVFTFGAVEQLASDFHRFIHYLILNKPRIVVHVEPVVELYDPRNVADALAIAFHKKRRYTEGLLPWLQASPDVDVLSVKRSYFGSLMHEGYSMIVWRPK